MLPPTSPALSVGSRGQQDALRTRDKPTPGSPWAPLLTSCLASVSFILLPDRWQYNFNSQLLFSHGPCPHQHLHSTIGFPSLPASGAVEPRTGRVM